MSTAPATSDKDAAGTVDVANYSAAGRVRLVARGSFADGVAADLAALVVGAAAVLAVEVATGLAAFARVAFLAAAGLAAMPAM